MDIKLKNNKKAILTAVVILAATSLCFVYASVLCKWNVDALVVESGSDFENEDFIRVLFQSNYVLYPELLEKCGKNYNIEDLYLSFDVERMPEKEYNDNETIYEGTGETLKENYKHELKESLNEINSQYTIELVKKVDYCAIDEDTQTIIKNTARSPELLLKGENQDYNYYFIVGYDKNGSISDIIVYGSDVEKFLKNAQSVANSATSLLFGGEKKTEYYLSENEFVIQYGEDNYAERSDMVSEVIAGTYVLAADRITVTQKNPQNVTFIYAMTEEQMGEFLWFPIYDINTPFQLMRYVGSSTERRSILFQESGIDSVYFIFLAIITGIFFIQARCMPQRLHDKGGIGWNWNAELIFTIQLILSAGLRSTVVNIVYIMAMKESIWGYVALFLIMFALFGIWYWCLLSIRGIFRDIRKFVRERSFVYRKCHELKEFLKGAYHKWKYVLCEVDLGVNNTKILKKFVIFQFVIMLLCLSFWYLGVFGIAIYSLLLYMWLKKYIGKIQKQYNNLINATNAIAQGKFDNDFMNDFGVFESYKKELYQIQDGFGKAVEEEVRSQRMKTELITNVSHDLKTPLTAIITYIDLLKDENITSEQRQSYLSTLERKSLRLKVLIEDLFEISKASSGNVKLEKVSIDICNLIRQVYLEHEEQMRECGLDVRFDLPDEKIILLLDSQKTYRIFENIYVNIIKYALRNTRVYIQAKMGEDIEECIRIVIKNISEQELTLNPMDLTERFVRGDTSRNTEGSGLGLAIARSFTELQGGKFAIETDGDLFKVIIEWALPVI